MIHLVIPGRPVPKGRPRFNPKTGRAYTPKETRVYERKVRLAAMAHGVKPIDGEVRLDLLMVYPDRRCGDLDNAIKGVADACQGVLFGDDKCVAEIHARREYDKSNPRVEVTVRGMGAKQ